MALTPPRKNRRRFLEEEALENFRTTYSRASLIELDCLLHRSNSDHPTSSRTLWRTIVSENGVFVRCCWRYVDPCRHLLSSTRSRLVRSPTASGTAFGRRCEVVEREASDRGHGGLDRVVVHRPTTRSTPQCGLTLRSWLTREGQIALTPPAPVRGRAGRVTVPDRARQTHDEWSPSLGLVSLLAGTAALQQQLAAQPCR